MSSPTFCSRSTRKGTAATSWSDARKGKFCNVDGNIDTSNGIDVHVSLWHHFLLICRWGDKRDVIRYNRILRPVPHFMIQATIEAVKAVDPAQPREAIKASIRHRITTLHRPQNKKAKVHYLRVVVMSTFPLTFPYLQTWCKELKKNSPPDSDDYEFACMVIDNEEKFMYLFDEKPPLGNRSTPELRSECLKKYRARYDLQLTVCILMPWCVSAFSSSFPYNFRIRVRTVTVSKS